MSLPIPLHAHAEHQAAVSLPPPTRQRTPLPVANSTRPFWLTSLDNVHPSLTEGSEGPLIEDADICIIGSGITGVSAAYHLSKALAEGDGIGRPTKAVVLEAREFCSGATGRNGGHLTAHVFPGFLHLEEEYGRDEALRAFAIETYTVSEVLKILKEHNQEDFVDLVPGGRLILFFSEQEYANAQADFVAAKEAGINLDNVQWFTKEEVQAKYGASYPAILTPGNNLWPLKLVSVLFNLANKIGSASSPSSPKFSVDIHTRTPVTAITKIASDASSRRYTLTTPRGPINCSYVLHATNGYVSHLLPYLQGPEGVVPTRGQIIAVRSNVTEDVLTKAAGSGNEGFEYWFPRPIDKDKNGTENATEAPLVIVGGGREVTKPKFELYEVDDGVVNKDVGKALRAFLPSVFPGKFEEGKEPEMEWTGIMGYTKSTNPFVGPVIDPSKSEDDTTYEGQYLAVGYSGHGMPRTFACAEAIAQIMVADMTGKKWTPPEWLPRSFLTKESLKGL